MEHCVPDHGEEIRRIKIFEMKAMMKLTMGTPRAIVSKILCGSSADVILAVGKLETIKKILRNYRESLINPLPYQFPSLRLSSILSNTHTNELFYRYGVDNYNNQIVHNEFLFFYSDSAVDALKRNMIWSVDGTFQVVPKPWYQLYSISFLQNNNVFPSIFIIFKNKKHETYLNAFNMLCRKISGLNPRIIKTDFEFGAINALKLCFPYALISGCQFHLGQALMRKLKVFNLYYLYKSNPIIKKFVKSLIALSYCDINQIIETFSQLKMQVDFPDILSPLYQYFYNNYISSDLDGRFPVTLWHALDIFDQEVPRTNNSIEGWHNAFKNSFGTSRYSFSLLITKLKDEEELIRQKRIRSEYNDVVCRRRRYVILEERLRNCIERNNQRFGAAYIFSIVDSLFY